MVINRRHFLRATGVTLALPLLDSLSRRAAGSEPGLAVTAGSPAGAKRPVRMVCVGNALGFYPPAFFPQNPGSNYELPTLLEPLTAHRKEFTVFSGLDHGLKGGHFAVHAFLSG